MYSPLPVISELSLIPSLKVFTHLCHLANITCKFYKIYLGMLGGAGVASHRRLYTCPWLRRILEKIRAANVAARRECLGGCSPPARRLTMKHNRNTQECSLRDVRTLAKKSHRVKFHQQSYACIKTLMVTILIVIMFITAAMSWGFPA